VRPEWQIDQTGTSPRSNACSLAMVARDEITIRLRAMHESMRSMKIVQVAET
jgi:hypothetical protein